jgi:hypothetical protein
MSDATVAIIWIGISVVVGITVSIALITRARNIQARAIGAHEDRYRQLAEESATVQENLATTIAEMNQRVGAIESVLREVSD